MLPTIIAVGLGFLAAALVFGLLKNLCVRLMWFGFGWKPNILDESQVKVTVRDCSKQFIEGHKAIRPEEFAGMSAGETQMMREDIENYTRWVIEQYILNFKLPTF
jgi:hypothetical protein